MMSVNRDSWDDCYALAEQLKRQSLSSTDALDDRATNEAVEATQAAVADLMRRSEQLRKRYGSTGL